MDPTATSRIDFCSPCDHQPPSSAHLHALPSPDPEFSRGRARRRDPLNPFALARHSHHHHHHHAASRESSTLRGRCRHRSLSRLNTPSGRSSHHHHQRVASPLPPAEKRRRRGQSPSRSRSPGGTVSANGTAAAAEGLLDVCPLVVLGGQRRRQRTQSRSRRHRLEGAFASVAVARRPRLDGLVAEDGDVNGKD